MKLERRKFIQLTALGFASAFSNLSLPALAKKAPAGPGTKPLAITMPSPDGRYSFLVDGKKQVIDIAGEIGNIDVPQHSCIIEYTGEDGITKLSVYIDQETSASSLFPALPVKEEEIESAWDAVLLGNPIHGGKIVARITGPLYTSPVVEIFDVQGNTLIKEKVEKSGVSDEYTFDVQRFSKGMLLVKVSCDDFTKTLKVMHSN